MWGLGGGQGPVSRIWRKEGLNVPKKQKSRPRLWLNDGGCVRLRAEQGNRTTSGATTSNPPGPTIGGCSGCLRCLMTTPCSAWPGDPGGPAHRRAGSE